MTTAAKIIDIITSRVARVVLWRAVTGLAALVMGVLGLLFL